MSDTPLGMLPWRPRTKLVRLRRSDAGYVRILLEVRPVRAPPPVVRLTTHLDIHRVAGTINLTIRPSHAVAEAAVRAGTRIALPVGMVVVLQIIGTTTAARGATRSTTNMAAEAAEDAVVADEHSIISLDHCRCEPWFQPVDDASKYWVPYFA